MQVRVRMENGVLHSYDNPTITSVGTNTNSIIVQWIDEKTGEQTEVTHDDVAFVHVYKDRPR